MKQTENLTQEEREQKRRALYQDVAQRQQSYRARALALFPHICASCCREFSGKRLRELTVHHKDHDHNNNPADGSNWELLCVYCHDHEHEKYLVKGHGGGRKETYQPKTDLSPFAGLDCLMDDKTGD